MAHPLSLLELQTTFLKSLRTREKYPEKCPSIERLIQSKGPITVERRLEIYQQSYRGRMMESLIDDFPRLQKQLGNDTFLTLLDEFIETHPSKHSNLAEFSQELPNYLKSISHPGFEMAMVDWLEILSWRAPEQPPNQQLTPEDLQSGMSFHLRLHPATNFFRGSDGCYMVFRNQRESQFKRVPQAELDLLEFFTMPRSTSELSRFFEAQKNLEIVLMEKLSEWIRLNIIICQRSSYV